MSIINMLAKLIKKSGTRALGKDVPLALNLYTPLISIL
jgi:hypothetical protein